MSTNNKQPVDGVPATGCFVKGTQLAPFPYGHGVPSSWTTYDCRLAQALMQTPCTDGAQGVFRYVTKIVFTQTRSVIKPAVW